MRARPASEGELMPSPMWLAHHWPEDYDRCVRVGRWHVCRRCIVLYPVAIAVAVLTAGTTWPVGLDVVVVAMLPLPGVVEFVGEQLGWWGYDGRRVVAVTVPMAVGLGRGLGRYVTSLGDPLFWVVVIAYSAVCLAAVAVRWRRDARAGSGAAEPSPPREQPGPGGPI